MKKITYLCSIFLLLAFSAYAGNMKNNCYRVVYSNVSGVMDGRFSFDGPWEGPWTVEGNVMGTLDSIGSSEMYTIHTTSADGTISGGSFIIVSESGDEIHGTYKASVFMISGDEALGTAIYS
jgi:hypothetical protein